MPTRPFHQHRPITDNSSVNDLHAEIERLKLELAAANDEVERLMPLAEQKFFRGERVLFGSHLGNVVDPCPHVRIRLDDAEIADFPTQFVNSVEGVANRA
jgi:hypothetical protein